MRIEKISAARSSFAKSVGEEVKRLRDLPGHNCKVSVGRTKCVLSEDKTCINMSASIDVTYYDPDTDEKLYQETIPFNRTIKT